eukprot:1317897-Ditylum_brightwellii.AAC.1
MVHPHNHAGTDGTMLFHGVDKSVDGGDKHLTHLTQAVGCCLKAKSEQSACVDDGKEDGVDYSVDSGDKYLTHLTQAVGCLLKAR